MTSSNGKESVEEVIRILGITEAQIADAFGRGSRPGK
jgi:hypothetical protein